MKKIFLLIVLVNALAGCSTSTVEKEKPILTLCEQTSVNLIGWWSGDGNPHDKAHNNHGEMINGATFSAGIAGQAFSFDGVDDYVTVQDAPILNPTDAITLSAWVKVKPTGKHQVIVSKFYGNYRNGPRDDSYWLSVNPDGAIGFQIETIVGAKVFDNILVTTPVNVFDEKFHLITGTYNGNAMRVYVDGQEVTSFARRPSSVTGPIQSSPNTPVLIGSGSNRNRIDWFVNGLVDELIILDTALSTSQILELNKAGTEGICKH